MFKIVNATISAIALLLSTPSILILVSWNTIPGDTLYTFKRGLEATVLAATGQTPVARRLKVEFVNRRFAESDRLLTEKKSIEGFKMAVSETKEATQQIIAAQDSGAKEKLVQNIIHYQEKLAERKKEIITQEIVTSPTATVPKTSQPTALKSTPSTAETPVPQPATAPPTILITPAQEPPPSQPQRQTEQKTKAVKEIEQTQKELEKIAKDLEEKVHKENKQSLFSIKQSLPLRDKNENKEEKED